MQLDLGFGERPEREEARAAEPRILTVSELTRAARLALEDRLGETWVQGEISNLRRQASGHQYFTLKDANAQLACVLFAGTARTLRGLRLADGQQVQLFGAVTVYEARGQYQLVVELAQEVGLGALQARFEALKAKLAAEGLFAAERKRPLPAMPTRVGVVTSPTGAAIRDFLKVLHRRMPGVEVIVSPVRVQGKGAAAEIAAAVGEFSAAPANGLPAVELVVVTRGGGSLEDLWEFNEEAVARAIAASAIPVVSAVGHEIDFTLADFAADFRAPTPSAAAELVVPDAAELRRAVADRAARLMRCGAEALRFYRARLDSAGRSALMREPARLLRERFQRLDQSFEAMRRAAQTAVGRYRDRVTHALAAERMGSLVRRQLRESAGRLAASGALLRSLSPQATLARGYSITFDEAGRVVRDAEALRDGDRILSRVANGEIRSVVARREAPEDEPRP